MYNHGNGKEHYRTVGPYEQTVQRLEGRVRQSIARMARRSGRRRSADRELRGKMGILGGRYWRRNHSRFTVLTEHSNFKPKSERRGQFVPPMDASTNSPESSKSARMANLNNARDVTRGGGVSNPHSFNRGERVVIRQTTGNGETVT